MAADITRVRVMVAAWSRSGKLSQDVLSLVEGHETHSGQREANHTTHNTSLHILTRNCLGIVSRSACVSESASNQVKTSVTTQKDSSQLGPGTT